jgi:hypothetical protein
VLGLARPHRFASCCLVSVGRKTRCWPKQSISQCQSHLQIYGSRRATKMTESTTPAGRFLVIFLLLPSVFTLAAQNKLQNAASVLPDRNVTSTPRVSDAYGCTHVSMHVCAVRHAHQTTNACPQPQSLVPNQYCLESPLAVGMAYIRKRVFSALDLHFQAVNLSTYCTKNFSIGTILSCCT